MSSLQKLRNKLIYYKFSLAGVTYTFERSHTNKNNRNILGDPFVYFVLCSFFIKGRKKIKKNHPNNSAHGHASQEV